MRWDAISRRVSGFDRARCQILIASKPMPSCHTTTQHFGNADLTIALAGNPNVGKSSLFNRMTGANVETANYPGKTVALNFGVTHFDGLRIGVVDLPGTYALGALSEDQWVARQAVLDDPP